MYAINFIQGVCPSDGVRKLRCKSTKGIMKELEDMRKWNGEIYIVPEMTEEAWNMSDCNLLSYCMNNYFWMITHVDYIKFHFVP